MKQLQSFSANVARIVSMVSIFLIFVMFSSCAIVEGILNPCGTDKNASLIIKVRDSETNMDIDNANVELLIDGSVFVCGEKEYIGWAVNGNFLFTGLPKEGFTISIAETENREEYLKVFSDGEFLAGEQNELLIRLERKKTLFKGRVFDAKDRKQLDGISVELNPGNYFTQTNSSGTYILEAPEIDLDYAYTLKFSDPKGNYFSDELSIPKPKKNTINPQETMPLKQREILEFKEPESTDTAIDTGEPIEDVIIDMDPAD
ncbi:MAG: hypothetical protein HN590_05500 [Calditrichaeota bacterium]|nr:hypothetical protein [Calditrichota bacterium]